MPVHRRRAGKAALGTASTLSPAVAAERSPLLESSIAAPQPLDHLECTRVQRQPGVVVSGHPFQDGAIEVEDHRRAPRL